MSEQALQDSWWLLTRARGTGLVLRLAVFVASFAALVFTRVASTSTPFLIEVAVVLCALWCLVSPDSHVGIFIALFVALDWLIAVDDATSPWALGVALSLLVVHTSLAAASISAPAASWSRAMRVRWLRRAGVMGLACVVVWLAVVAVNVGDMGASTSLVAAALVVLAVGALWVADVTIDRRATVGRGSRAPTGGTKPSSPT